MNHLTDFEPDALRERFRSEGWPAYRADQVVEWLYRHGVDDPAEMTNLPAAIRDALAKDWRVHALEVADCKRSVDGTRKLALRTHDGRVIEAVLIPEERRVTLCLSTQVGCALACSFCATGALGFDRNLSTAEILDQVLHAQAILDPGESLTNLVFMGMGEPLLNLKNLVPAIRTLIHPKAFAFAPRRVTVSTAGLVSRLPELLEVAPINLAVSLHATTDETRDELVPLNRKIPLNELLGALRAEPLVTRRRPVFFEYTLMAGVNDSPEDARRLAGLVRGIPCKLNVIPMNEHADARYRAPSDAAVDAFTAAAHAAGLRVTLRRNRGRDIDAACGQLARRGVEPSGAAPGVASEPEGSPVG